MTTIEPAIFSICISPSETSSTTDADTHSIIIVFFVGTNHSCPLCRDEVNINPPEEVDNTNTIFGISSKF